MVCNHLPKYRIDLKKISNFFESDVLLVVMDNCPAVASVIVDVIIICSRELPLLSLPLIAQSSATFAVLVRREEGMAFDGWQFRWMTHGGYLRSVFSYLLCYSKKKIGGDSSGVHPPTFLAPAPESPAPGRWLPAPPLLRRPAHGNNQIKADFARPEKGSTVPDYRCVRRKRERLKTASARSSEAGCRQGGGSALDLAEKG